MSSSHSETTVPASANLAGAMARREQALLDLAEVEEQLASGELDAVTADRLRDLYRIEIAQTDQELGEDEPPSPAHSQRGGRLAVAAALAVAVVTGLVWLAASSSFGRGQGTLTGGFQGMASESAGSDPTGVSDETLEAVIAANEESPQIAGMRLALADRYFARGDYRRAFPHYQAIIEGSASLPAVVATAYARLGWMVYDGNGESALALELLDRALELVPGDPVAIYAKAIITWCGLGDADGALRLLSAVLDSDLDADWRLQLQADLDALRRGEPCR